MIPFDEVAARFRFGDGRDWFFARRFGLFVHWGIYAVGGVHEQEPWRYGTGMDAYAAYAARFNPRGFDPAAWLDMAENAGMEYIVFTAKHHDGFAMWDTAETDFSVMHTPYGRDPLRLLADECHRRDFPLVLYYSVVDWRHENYPNLGRHHEIVTPPEKHDLPAYLGFLKRQVRELCSNYGKIHGIWWDMNVAGARDPSVNAMVRELQPAAVVNNRGLDDGDFSTPERTDDERGQLPPFDKPTEGCNSVGVNSWGYSRREDYYSLAHLQRQIAAHLARGGNFLLNVGPDGRGVVPAAARRLLGRIGAWKRAAGGALTAPPRPGLVDNPAILCTGEGKTLNLVLLETPKSSTLSLEPLATLPRRATLLNPRTELEPTLERTAYDRDRPPALRLRRLPVDRLAGTVPVIQLAFP